MSNNALKPASKLSELIVSNTEREQVDITQRITDAPWKMIVVYRGQHCPMCTKQLNALAKMTQDFKDIGVEVVAVSGDSHAQLEAHYEKLDVNFPLYYNLTLEQMTELGLYISEPRSTTETDHPFAEPAIIVLNEQNQVQVLDKSNSPFSRPDMQQLLSGIQYTRENDYPIRGTFS